MCGITAYLGNSKAKDILVDTLKRLEYRGYDSCGMVVLNEGKFRLWKLKGKVSELEGLVKDKRIDANIGISHTRWATHGAPNKINAHPHTDCHKKIFVVHNGIIENFEELKKKLVKEGHHFTSDTDTEVIPHLIEKFYKGDLLKAVLKAIKVLKGSFAIGIVSVYEPDKIIGVRYFSPLIAGLNKEEKFLASDLPALLPFTDQVIFLEEESVILMTKEKIKVFDFEGKPKDFEIKKVDLTPEQAQKKGFKHFMLKEIFEQPDVMKNLYSLYIDKTKKINFKNLDEKFLKRVERVLITACGTAFHAGLVAKYLLEKFCKIKCETEISSEFRYRDVYLDKEKDLMVCISQSGETADTLACLRRVKEKGVKVLGVCNVLGSSLYRESDFLIYTNAGPEIGVASTKAYTAQIACMFLFALYLAKLKNKISEKEYLAYLKEFEKVADFQREILLKSKKIRTISKKFSKFGCFLYLGRNINYPSALEGALKLKEISYIPAEGYAAGEMKHGPIALIDEYRAVVCINPKSFVYEKMLSNMQEIKARKGKIVSILTEGDKLCEKLSDEVIFIPQIKEELSPLLVALPLQLFAYYLADNLGLEIDKPRNLAKSVTVE